MKVSCYTLIIVVVKWKKLINFAIFQLNRREGVNLEGEEEPGVGGGNDELGID